ncbi:MAG TPA: alpha-amylase family glycosyl hydrolase [Acidocella sp.]|nr:alpha-amylase family glycosyl hydrolase [Acidocella sp.]
MRTTRGYPSLFQINTRVWLRRLARQRGKRMTLADVDDATIDRFAQRGFDWVYLLSVWQTGRAGQVVSRNNREWLEEFRTVLPDLVDEDMDGSGFAITAYTVDDELGGEAGLTAFREKLAQRGIRLMLDFVPNHTALDHPWAKTHPDYYVQGREEQCAAAPQNYRRMETEIGPRILAHGRDPNFPGWPDTLQLNYGNTDLHKVRIEELIAIAGKCDGVRCDMAMLLLPEVFQRTWAITPAPFWPKAIESVRQAHPSFTFMAEVYWDLEWTLQQQGFDYCYDKRLYDRLKSGSARSIREHLKAGLDYQNKLARFLENHDEPRAASTFPWPRHRAAAVITFLSPGLRFFHQGQFEGARVRIPVHLSRGPEEPINQEIEEFYHRFLKILKETEDFRGGEWSLIEPSPAWAGNGSSDGFVAFSWTGNDRRSYVIVVNYRESRGQCHLVLPFHELGGRHVRLTDMIGDEVYDRDGSDLVGRGLYIDQDAWQVNIFEVKALGL